MQRIQKMIDCIEPRHYSLIIPLTVGPGERNSNAVSNPISRAE